MLLLLMLLLLMLLLLMLLLLLLHAVSDICQYTLRHRFFVANRSFLHLPLDERQTVEQAGKQTVLNNRELENAVGGRVNDALEYAWPRELCHI
ncbi:hypothetical protein K432DRAFT_381085 [Lepidopterella palustris CBS 459.81]|uniref:Uncharacterized protein n=1 Tax=Lepidopterella palustris CBS 459.81 TaxID=1314670 RepID=A0A8E2ECS7_9PEZI|nr:hypothetical protein K432DRAFT_381085 [Lepidopterella palustris CBS 459.81]